MRGAKDESFARTFSKGFAELMVTCPTEIVRAEYVAFDMW